MACPVTWQLFPSLILYFHTFKVRRWDWVTQGPFQSSHLRNSERPEDKEGAGPDLGEADRTGSLFPSHGLSAVPLGLGCGRPSVSITPSTTSLPSLWDGISPVQSRLTRGKAVNLGSWAEEECWAGSVVPGWLTPLRCSSASHFSHCFLIPPLCLAYAELQEL